MTSSSRVELATDPEQDAPIDLPSGLQAVFIADLHLGEEVTARHLAFRDFLAKLSTIESPPQLYIVGDLFDYWAGRTSEKLEGIRFVLLCLRRASREGLSISFQSGNRDFLFDDEFGSRHGVRVLPEKAPLRLGELRVLATHGDALVYSDRKHLFMRCILRSAWVRWLAAVLPESFVATMAKRIREANRGDRPRRPSRKRFDFDIAPLAAARLLRGGFDMLVCGHIHRETRRHLELDGTKRELLTLGAWEERASYLTFDGERFEFHSYPIEEP